MKRLLHLISAFLLIVLASSVSAQSGAVLTPENISSVSALAQFDVPDADTLLISPDGALLASYTVGGPVTTWDISGEEPAQLAVIEVMANDTAFSPDSSQLVIASMRVEAYDPTSGEEVLEYAVFSIGTWAIAFSPDGASLGAQVGFNETDNTVAIYDTESGDAARILETTTSARSVAFSPDGTLFAWDNPARQLVEIGDISGAVASTTHEIPFLGGAIYSLDFSPDGRWLAMGSEDGSQWIWDVENNAGDLAFSDPIASPVTHLEFSPTADMMAAVGTNGEFAVYDTRISQIVLEGDGMTRSFVWLPDGSGLITLDDSGVATLWGVAE